ncbi:MAG: hypothetical protein QNJ55_04890 [Xenococcus sp. MO_188.B8]|nr:hypothetical protein [Xenococcus sp. MO_188.B8]
MVNQVDKDELFIDEAEAIFRSAYRKYRRASAVEKAEMFDSLSIAATSWVKAQAKLVEPDHRVTQELLDEIRQLKRDIDDAARTQQFITAMLRVGAILVAL